MRNIHYMSAMQWWSVMHCWSKSMMWVFKWLTASLQNIYVQPGEKNAQAASQVEIIISCPNCAYSLSSRWLSWDVADLSSPVSSEMEERSDWQRVPAAATPPCPWVQTSAAVRATIEWLGHLCAFRQAAFLTLRSYTPDNTHLLDPAIESTASHGSCITCNNWLACFSSGACWSVSSANQSPIIRHYL